MKKSLNLLFCFVILLCYQAISIYGEESCYELGYRYGICATQSMNGIACKPENDIIIPEKCRGQEETKKGISAGVKAVYDALNLDTSKTNSTSTLNMLATPIDVLVNQLGGKSKSEIKRLVGSPNRTNVSAGYECWIYGNTYTDEDRAIVFDGDNVLTVTFY